VMQVSNRTAHNPPAIRAMNISKSLGGTQLLDNISIEIEPQTVTAIAGPNGVGKTILLCCLSGALAPDTGTITMGTNEGTAQHVFAPQGSLALPGLTGRETIDFYQSLHPSATDRWRDLVTTFKLTPHLDELVRNYSGGMQQLLELTIAFSVSVPIIILDEPSANLDPTMVQTVHDVIRSKRDAGTTVVFTTHTPVDAELADELLVMTDTGITVSGVPQTLRDSLPPIIARSPTAPIPESVPIYGDRWVRHGDVLHGFARNPDVRPGVEEVSGRSIVEPSFRDLFAYYTEVEPLIAHRPGAEK